MRCQYCGSDIVLPFKCPFCGGYFCAEHRLPELHTCQSFPKSEIISKASFGGHVKEEHAVIKVRRRGFNVRFLSNWSSPMEALHLLLGTLMVIVIGFSIIFEYGLLRPAFLWLPIIFSSIFMLHEIGHKIIAKYYGLWAEFRLTFLGIIITLISIFSPIKVVSPGSVIISGEADKRIIGKTALAGPLINIILSSIFLALRSIAANQYRMALIWGSNISAWVALFNLIPISMLDGAKIFWWNRYIWTLSFLTSTLLVIISLMLF